MTPSFYMLEQKLNGRLVMPGDAQAEPPLLPCPTWGRPLLFNVGSFWYFLIVF